MHGWSEIIGIPARMRRKAMEVGPLYALQLIYWQIVPQWLFDLNVWVVTITDIRSRAGNTDHDPAIRWANECDIDALAQCGLGRAKITTAFEKNVKIAIFERDGRIIAHHQYFAAMHEQDDWLLFKVRPDDVAGGTLWVAPDHRGSTILTPLLG